jgi:ankyrin repeat protein
VCVCVCVCVCVFLSFLSHIVLLHESTLSIRYVDVTDSGGKTALHWAVLQGKEAIVKLLLQRDADPGAIDEDHSRTPLHYAASLGKIAVTRALLQADAEVDSLDEYLLTPLLLACDPSSFQPGAATLLLDAGADVHVVDEEGEGVLASCAVSGHLPLIRRLLKQGADVSAENENGVTPVMEAARNGHVDAMRTLLEVGKADGAHLDAAGVSLLHCAVKGGSVATVQYLLRDCADVDVTDESGKTPLFRAAVESDQRLIAVLLEHGALPLRADINGVTPIHAAALKGSVECLRALLAQVGASESATAGGLDGAVLQRRDVRGMTPLHYASHQGHPAAVRFLLSCGAERTLTNAEGLTSLEVARERNQKQVVAVFESAEAATPSPAYTASSAPPLSHPTRHRATVDERRRLPSQWPLDVGRADFAETTKEAPVEHAGKQEQQDVAHLAERKVAQPGLGGAFGIGLSLKDLQSVRLRKR